MSTLNMHPPQTYSRLFRPWDTNRSTTLDKPTVSSPAAVQLTAVKTECCSPEPSPSTSRHSIKTEEDHNNRHHHSSSNSSLYLSNDSDRDECASSSSSGDSSSQSSSSPMASPSSGVMRRRQMLPHQHAHHPYGSPAAFNAAQLYGGDAMPAAMDLPSLAAATASASAPNTAATAPASVPSSDFYYAAAAAAAATGSHAAFGMDPYTLGLMEQEYARVMAEDAQLKALNARKQRPKKFKCPHCDVAFSNNGQLKGHIRIHTGERPFKCDVESCGKTFTRNEELTRHKRIHTGLRPYPCSMCGKRFGRRDHLKKHMKTHMPQERQMGPAIFVPLYPYLYGY